MQDNLQETEYPPTYLLGAIDDEIVCDVLINSADGIPSEDEILDIFDALLAIAIEEHGNIYPCYPYRSASTGNAEDVRGELIGSGEDLWDISESSGSVMDSGLLVGDDIDDTFHIYQFASSDISQMEAQGWDDLASAAWRYLEENDIG